MLDFIKRGCGFIEEDMNLKWGVCFVGFLKKCVVDKNRGI